MNVVGLLFPGLLMAAFSAGVYSRTESGAMAIAGCLLLAMVGIGRALAGLFPCDPGCTLPPASFSASVHSIVGMTALWSGVLAPLVFSAAARPFEHRWIVWTSLAFGFVEIGAMMVGFGLGREAPIISLLQRIVLMSFYGWVAVLGVWLCTKPR
jgi:hypothetical protein